MSRSSSSYHSSLRVGMQAALHQDLIAAEGDRLLDLLVAAPRAAGRSLRRRFGLAVERAEVADGGADVGVVDVAVDVVRAVRLGMQPARDGVGGAAQRRQVVRLEQLQAFVRASAARRRRPCQASRGNGRSPSSTPAGRQAQLGGHRRRTARSPR